MVLVLCNGVPMQNRSKAMITFLNNVLFKTMSSLPWEVCKKQSEKDTTQNYYGISMRNYIIAKKFNLISNLISLHFKTGYQKTKKSCREFPYWAFRFLLKFKSFS